MGLAPAVGLAWTRRPPTTAGLVVTSVKPSRHVKTAPVLAPPPDSNAKTAALIPVKIRTTAAPVAPPAAKNNLATKANANAQMGKLIAMGPASTLSATRPTAEVVVFNALLVEPACPTLEVRALALSIGARQARRVSSTSLPPTSTGSMTFVSRLHAQGWSAETLPMKALSR